MQIIVDDQPFQHVGPSDITLADLAQEVCRDDGPDQRMVVSLHCDGRPVAQDTLDAALSTPISRFQSIEFQTQSIPDLVCGTLEQTIELLEEATDIRHRCADTLSEGRYEDAMEHLRRFCGMWKQIQDAIVICAQTLNVDLDAIESGGDAFTAIVERIRTLLNDLKEAMEAQDSVLIGDILRYEFDEATEQWMSILHDLRDRAGRV